MAGPWSAAETQPGTEILGWTGGASRLLPFALWATGSHGMPGVTSFRYTHAHTYICMYIYMYIHVYIHIYIVYRYVSTYLYTYTYMYMYVCVIYKHGCAYHTYIHICSYVFIQVQIGICIHLYIYIQSQRIRTSNVLVLRSALFPLFGTSCFLCGRYMTGRGACSHVSV